MAQNTATDSKARCQCVWREQGYSVYVKVACIDVYYDKDMTYSISFMEVQRKIQRNFNVNRAFKIEHLSFQVWINKATTDATGRYLRRY